MIQDVQKELAIALSKSHDALKRELTKLRAGRANASLLDGIKADYYGTPTALPQMAHINIPEPRLITVKPWDKTQIKAVEKALRESDLGLNPLVDGDLVRIPLPPLTEERRKEFVKIARKYGEDCKVAIRKARHDALDLLSQLETEGESSADEVDSTIAHKEKDILEV
jgi:ribosome recycling factor